MTPSEVAVQPKLISLHVGKMEAGIAILLTSDLQMIEFPTLLLPQGIQTGHVVQVSVSRSPSEEHLKRVEFTALQESILAAYVSPTTTTS